MKKKKEPEDILPPTMEEKRIQLEKSYTDFYLMFARYLKDGLRREDYEWCEELTRTKDESRKNIFLALVFKTNDPAPAHTLNTIEGYINEQLHLPIKVV